MAFDAGSGVCLWAENEAARERFGYPVHHSQLPLSDNTKRWFDYLVAWFDTSVDWSHPGGDAGRWTDAELRRFQAAATKGLELLRLELPSAEFRVAQSVGASS
jgi:hypothetical protein